MKLFCMILHLTQICGLGNENHLILISQSRKCIGHLLMTWFSLQLKSSSNYKGERFPISICRGSIFLLCIHCLHSPPSRMCMLQALKLCVQWNGEYVRLFFHQLPNVKGYSVRKCQRLAWSITMYCATMRITSVKNDQWSHLIELQGNTKF